MPRTTAPPASALPWRKGWAAPFLWLTLTPLVTVPLSALLFYSLAGTRAASDVGLPHGPACDGWFCPIYGYSEVEPTLLSFVLPGLLNLAPFIWVFSSNRRARLAGLVAGLLGMAHFTLPALLLLVDFERLTSSVDGESYFQYQGAFLLEVVLPASLSTFGGLAWLACLVVWWLFAIWGSGIEKRSAAWDGFVSGSALSGDTGGGAP